MLIRALALIIGASILVGVVYLGVLSGTDASVVPWFGIASAIGAPIGLSLVTYTFVPSHAGAIRSLAKIPQIEALVKKAETEEARVAQLEKARLDLEALIEAEATRQATLDRLHRLKREAGRVLSEFEALEQELPLFDANVEETVHTKAAIEGLRARLDARQRGDIVLQFESRTIVVESSLLAALPLGRLIKIYLRLLEEFLRRRRSLAAEPTH